MTPGEKRVEIAEAMGWKELLCFEDSETGYQVWSGLNPKGCLEPRTREIVPDYLNDLNAMHEAEKIFDTAPDWPSSPRYAYSRNLYNVIVPKTDQPFRATAEQRADAFLLTIQPTP